VTGVSNAGEIVKAGAPRRWRRSPPASCTILTVAQASAEAAKEGGLLGIGGTLVARKCKPRSTPSRFPSADAAA